MIMKKSKSSQPTNLQIRDVVKVRSGFKDPDTNLDMSDWHGRITELYPEHGTAMIAFDSQTLQNMPPQYITRCEREGYGWESYGYDLADLTKVEARDTLVNVHKTIQKLASEHAYDHLGDEGEEIQRIMQTIDPDDELAALDSWLEYLEQELKFPFEAVVDEWQERGPLRAGDKVRVHAIEDIDEHYGIIVKLRRGREQFYMPLCDLAAIDENSPAYHFIGLYRTWFANR
jgi:hypothetical protein